MEANTTKISLSRALTWDRCRFLYKMKYVDEWDTTKPRYKMDLGNMGHHILFDFYRTGQDNSERFANVWLEDLENLNGEQIQNVAVAVAQFRLYREEFSPQVDRGLITEALEYHFEVELTTPKGRKYILEGYIDRMSRDQRGLLWVEDYKWTGRFWSDIEVLMDPQLPLYAAALRRLGIPVHGLMVTQINTYPYKDRSKKKIEELFKRDTFPAGSEDQSDNILHQYGMLVDEMIDNKDQEMRRSLRRDCKMCDFQDPCLMGLKGLNVNAYISTSPGFTSKTPRPVDRQDGVPVPLIGRTRIPEVSVEGQDILIQYDT